MKKYLILICAIFITGCSAEYNLIIKDNSYKDSLLLYGNQNLLKEQLEEEDNNIDIMIATIRQEKPKNKEKIIEKSIDVTGYEYTSSGKIKNLESNSIVNLFYDEVSIKEENNIITIKTSDAIRNGDYGTKLDDVVINIKTNRKLIETNAHSKKQNTYTWRFESGDLDEGVDHTIYIKLGEKQKVSIKTYMLIGGSSFLVIILYVLIKRKISNSF